MSSRLSIDQAVGLEIEAKSQHLAQSVKGISELVQDVKRQALLE